MKLQVTEWGTGDRYALLVHGLFSDATSWHRAGPALAERGFHVLAPDLRGHGESPRGRYSPFDWALDLVDTLPARAEIAVGHSLGGLVLGMAARLLDPGSAVYLDPAWRMSADAHERYRDIWLGWLDWTDKEQLRAHLGGRWPEEDLDLRWTSMWKADPGIIPGLVPGGGHDLSPERADMPSLVLAADPSEFIPDDHAKELRERGLTVETVEGTGHSAFREDFPRFLDRLDAWIETSGRPAAGVTA
ncbi:alpha/beta fold hydrolase [Actinomadura roseirufa]|uniref:alpha/beta fold hydrolase n=1 Tax=Actinomadura roseirufa TaxID=2094049 RepID=UPI0013F175B8|nr:alpha/beta hydrolase [Actinomadura roseirufa]